MNIAEIEESLRGLVEQRFDPSEFPYRFLEIYGAPKATVTKLRQSQAGAMFGGDVLLKKRLFFRVAPKGKAAATVDAMAADNAAKKHAPRFLMATDGDDFYALDAKKDRSCDSPLSKLHDSFDFFLPLAGYERHEGVGESQADIKATARLAKLYDAILESNPDWIQRDHTHELNLFMTRMLFCFFAEDTGIFDENLFTSTVMSSTVDDGSDTSSILDMLFAAMDTPDSKRSKLSVLARKFPFVNGGLFRERTAVPSFSKRARRLLRECGDLIWRDISPDIFGSMIQAVVEPGMRGDMGMHYTSVPNIMKALRPLFLMSLEEELESSRDSVPRLNKLLGRIYSIRIFDPACGSGNFLIIAYRELRKIESRIFERQRAIGQLSLPMTGIRLTQFCGIEIADFAAETAKLSLWIAEYQMNAVFKAEFGDAPPALPLSDSGNIVHANALMEDWLEVCPPKDGAETYVVGNPPYLGSSNQSAAQKADMDLIFSPITKSYKNLDYVAAWYLKGADYCAATEAQCAFVATNSICQGEQVDMLWPLVYARGNEIGFAHQSFKWRNNAAHNAGVTCVIVGIRGRRSDKKVLYSGDMSRVVKNIGPYLLEMDDTIVEKEARPINRLQRMEKGNMPTDDGNLILSTEEKDELLRAHPKASAIIRRYYGSQEYIKGGERWCLWVLDAQRAFAESIPSVKARFNAVAKFRLASPAPTTREYAIYPHRFRQIQNFGADAILVPRHFSEDREYFTVGFIDGATSVISDACFAIYEARPYVMALLSSRLHAVWVSTVCGGLETRIRYSNTLGYHTFPVPMLSQEQERELDDHAWSIVAAREAHPGKTIAWLYDPETMPPEVLTAHWELDQAVERIYIGRAFKNDTERLEYLFKQYSAMKRKQSGPATREMAFKGARA